MKFSEIARTGCMEVDLFCSVQWFKLVCCIQGRILYDVILYRLKAEKPTVLIECQRDVASDLVSKLLQYRLRKKVLQFTCAHLLIVFSAIFF